MKYGFMEERMEEEYSRGSIRRVSCRMREKGGEEE
jgi:hypothetical protein